MLLLKRLSKSSKSFNWPWGRGWRKQQPPPQVALAFQWKEHQNYHQKRCKRFSIFQFSALYLRWFFSAIKIVDVSRRRWQKKSSNAMLPIFVRLCSYLYDMRKSSLKQDWKMRFSWCHCCFLTSSPAHFKEIVFSKTSLRRKRCHGDEVVMFFFLFQVSYYPQAVWFSLRYLWFDGHFKLCNCYNGKYAANSLVTA